MVPDGLLLASKQNDPLPILVPIPPVQILLGETFQLIIDGSPYGTPVPIPQMDIGSGDVTIHIAPQDRPGGNPNRRYQVTYRYVGGGADEIWPTPIPFIVDLIEPGFPGPLPPPSIAASIVNNVLDDATLTALGNQVPATIYAYAGIDPGDDVYLQIDSTLTQLPVLNGAVGPVNYPRALIE
ncbi:hypothetical protein, partial [Burkholderia ubonensis]|uniref:hypothetical protein n=1 Tax=Burkholderia ubonensis TaxID=101571 RepID=UPI0012F75E41